MEIPRLARRRHVIAASAGATNPYQDGPLGPQPLCSPATGVSGWKNTTYDAAAKKWTGERDLTLACVKPAGSSANSPCEWCYRIKLERRVLGVWQHVGANSQDLELACDASEIRPQAGSWFNLTPGTTYKVTSEIAVGACDSPNLTFLFPDSIEFTAN